MLSKPTIIRALCQLRTICSNKFLNSGMKISGVGKTVEIDESKFDAKRKYQPVEYQRAHGCLEPSNEGPRKCCFSMFQTLGVQVRWFSS